MLNDTIENYRQKYKVEFYMNCGFIEGSSSVDGSKSMEAHFHVMKKIQILYLIIMT